MQLATGVLQRVQEREAGIAPNTWTEQTLVIADLGVTHYATVTRDFGPLPSPGEHVAVEVGVRPYVKKGTERAGFGLTAFRRVPDVEAALFGLASTSAA